MSEAASLEPEAAMQAPHEKEHKTAEIIDFTDAAAERAVSDFIETIHDAMPEEGQSMEIAVAIDTALSGKPEEAADTETRNLLELMVRADAFGDSAAYDHKDEYDAVFHQLVMKLQSTRDRQNALKEQRRAALRLTELRATLSKDKTPHDDKWHDIINRLFD